MCSVGSDGGHAAGEVCFGWFMRLRLGSGLSGSDLGAFAGRLEHLGCLCDSLGKAPSVALGHLYDRRLEILSAAERSPTQHTLRFVHASQHGARQRSLDEIDRPLRFEGVDYEPAHLEVRHVRGWVGQVENLTVGLLVQGCLKKGLCHVVHMDSRSPLALLHLDGAASDRSTNGLKA